jgi:uracil phosphoribosyltransferase
MKITLVDHPLVQHKLAHLRDKRTGPKDFRELAEELSLLMAYEAMRDLELTEATVETPVAPARVKVLSGKKLALVAILRAGLVMVEGILKLVPHARVGHIGLYRDPESLKPVQYYAKLPPDIAERRVFLLDPMLATGEAPATPSPSSRKRGPPASSSCASSPPRRAWSASPGTTPTPRWWWPPLTSA